MTSRIAAADIARHLTAAGHANSTTGSEWQPGYRAQQASPRTVRVWRDGPDEQQHLDQYGTALQAAGYTVTHERAAGRRPALRATQP